jgi:hypothetical protein
LSHAMRENNLHPDKMTITLSEDDGRAMEHILTREQRLVISGAFDPRYSTRKADGHIREFKLCGVTFQYRTRPFMLPSGKVV